MLSLRYSDIMRSQSSLVLWLQPSLPLSRFNLSHLHVKMTPHLTSSSNQELGSHIIKYKHMVVICLDLWTIHSEYQHILQLSILYWVINSMFHLFLTSRWSFLLLFYFELLQNLTWVKHPDITLYQTYLSSIDTSISMEIWRSN